MTSLSPHVRSELCSVEGCSKPTWRRDFCNPHYLRWRRHGNPLGGRRNARPVGMTEAEAFAWFMPGDPPIAPSPTEGCWDWPAATDKYGYGMFRLNGKGVSAHQASYRIHHGPIPSGLCVLHSCDRPICVQPAHLHVDTHAANTREMLERGRHTQTRLTEAEVSWVRQSPLGNTRIAQMLGVHRTTIYDIRHGRSWK